MSVEAINNVFPILDSLEQNVSSKESQKTLHDLLKGIDEIISQQKKPDTKQYSYKMKLCSCQMAKVLPSLCKIISSGSDPAFKEICQYLIAKLRWCLSEILRLLNGGGMAQDTEPSGLFIQSMDNFVSFINDEKRKEIQVKSFVDDLLCHALTIAKMAENEDYNEITAACKNVLACTSEVNSIDEIEKEPLKKDTILCALVNLERKVNVAVLRLFLYATSKFLPSLKSIIKKAGTVAPPPDRRPGDIDQELQSLDLYFERVQLIGNYAVACTECKRQKIIVQSTLASLEFVAEYIIPAAESYYMDPTNLVKRRFLQFLTDECIEELKILSNSLDNIIDTATFFQVLQEDLSHSVPNLKIKFSKGNYDPQESSEIITKCYKFAAHLKTTDDPAVKNNKPLMDKAKEFIQVVKAHSDLTMNNEIIEKDKINENLDNLIIKVEEIEEILASTYLEHQAQTINVLPPESSFNEGVYSKTPKRTGKRMMASTPLLMVTKENGFEATPQFPQTPMEPNDGALCLEPYLNKILETPVIRSTLYTRTPYKSLRKGTPRNLSLDISEVLDSLDINCKPEDGAQGGELNSSGYQDGIYEKVYFENELPSDLSLKSSESISIDTFRRKMDLEILENKIKQLTTETKQLATNKT